MSRPQQCLSYADGVLDVKPGLCLRLFSVYFYDNEFPQVFVKARNLSFLSLKGLPSNRQYVTMNADETLMLDPTDETCAIGLGFE